MVGVETAKLKSANIISYTTRHNVVHAVALLAPSNAPLRELYMYVASSALACCQFIKDCCHLSLEVHEQSHGFANLQEINGPETPPPNLRNSADIFLRSVWYQTAKFKDGQYFWLYGIYPT